MDSAKERKAIERLKAFEPADGYYLAYSGGKIVTVSKFWHNLLELSLKQYII